MQTSSKVSYDNWSDWNLCNQIMNIRPVGTYCFCDHCCHHHHCCDDEFTDSCIKCEHRHDCDHCHPCPPPPPMPPHHHCPCHDPHLFPIDKDGDGFVEGDLITKIPDTYIPDPIPPVIGADSDSDLDDDTESTKDINNDSTNTEQLDNTSNYYGSNLVVSVPKEIKPVETSEEIDSILDDNKEDDIVTTDEDGYHTLADEVPTEEDNWETSKMLNSDTGEIVEKTPVPAQELKEVEQVPSVEITEEKSVRGRRRVNRGGRRKKED